MAEILLVSGSWQVRILLKAELEEHGHCVHALDSLADGLEYLRRRPWPPDLILVDTTQLLLSDDDLRELEKAAGGVPILLSVGPTGPASNRPGPGHQGSAPAADGPGGCRPRRADPGASRRLKDGPATPAVS
jgi:hypothetical protein